MFMDLYCLYDEFDRLFLWQADVVNKMFAPVTNVLKLITGDGRKPFYTGTLVHPDQLFMGVDLARLSVHKISRTGLMGMRKPYFIFPKPR